MSSKSSVKTRSFVRFSTALSLWVQGQKTTQGKAAEALGIKQSTLNGYLNKKGGCSLANMEALCDKIGYDLQDFLAMGRELQGGKSQETPIPAWLLKLLPELVALDTPFQEIVHATVKAHREA
jgi:predicted XRE-type DNA-binding protein